MSYRPPRQKSEFERGERVIGKFRPVKIEGDKGVKVLWRTEQGETRSALVKLDDLFDNVAEQVIQVIKSGYDGTFNITFDTTMTKVVNFHPANGQFKVKVAEFISSEDEDPKPKVYTGRYGDMIKFNILLKVVEPKGLQGITFVHQMFYEKFVPIENPDTEKIETGFSSPPGNSKHCDMLSDFCDATGIWKFGAIPWSDNILPELAKRVDKSDQSFNVVLNGGWVEHIYPIQDFDEDEPEDVWEDETSEVIDLDDVEEVPFDLDEEAEEDEEFDWEG